MDNNMATSEWHALPWWALACASVSKLQRGLAMYVIRWFQPLKGIVCPRYIPLMEVASDK